MRKSDKRRLARAVDAFRSLDATTRAQVLRLLDGLVSGEPHVQSLCEWERTGEISFRQLLAEV